MFFFAPLAFHGSSRVRVPLAFVFGGLCERFCRQRWPYGEPSATPLLLSSCQSTLAESSMTTTIPWRLTTVHAAMFCMT